MDIGPIRVLVSAYAPVPGTNPHSTALLGMASSLVGELDLVTVKTDHLSYLEELHGTQMFRVPVGPGNPTEQRETFARAVARQLESRHYDAVHMRGPSVGRAIARQKETAGFRLIYEVSTFPDEGEGPDSERRWTEDHELSCDIADLIMVPTEAAVRALSERGHGGKVVVVTPGVNVDHYDWWPVAEDPTLRILYLGSFEADRGLGTLFDALRTVRKQRRLDVLVAGDADPHRRERVQRMVDAFSLTEVVRIRGEPSGSLPMIIGAADVCVTAASASPRFQEFGDLPQPLLEFLACRRPVVAAGVPGTAEIVRDEREALLYPPDDATTLAESIDQIASEPLLRERLVEAAYERTRWRYSAGARRRRIAEIYESMFPGSQRFDPWEEGFDPGDSSMAIAYPAEGTDASSTNGSNPRVDAFFHSADTKERIIDPNRTVVSALPNIDTQPQERATASHLDDEITRVTPEPDAPAKPRVGKDTLDEPRAAFFDSETREPKKEPSSPR